MAWLPAVAWALYQPIPAASARPVFLLAVVTRSRLQPAKSNPTGTISVCRLGAPNCKPSTAVQSTLPGSAGGQASVLNVSGATRLAPRSP